MAYYQSYSKHIVTKSSLAIFISREGQIERGGSGLTRKMVYGSCVYGCTNLWIFQNLLNCIVYVGE